MKIRNRTALLVVLILFIFADALAGCGQGSFRHSSRNDVNETLTVEPSSEPEEQKPEAETEKPNLLQSILPRKNDKPQGPEWSIYVYLCGSDLESEDAIGTEDMREMQEGSKGGHVRFIVETGGSKKWHNDFTSALKNQRFLIENGRTRCVWEDSRRPMNDYKTLSDFISFCRNEYPSSHTGLVFWNHGGGSITGLCFDENEDNYSLSLIGVERALSETIGKQGRNFDFIGFDTCLMATLETACMIKDYANYMYASQENESEIGWQYGEIGKFISENPETDGGSLGKEIAEIVYRSCESEEERDNATCSVTDLEAVELLITEFDLFSKELYEATGDRDVLSSYARAVSEKDNFGGNNRSEGYTNMVDLGGVIESGQDMFPHANAALASLKRAVKYVKNGKNHKRACGLSVYYPLVIGGTMELAVFGQVSASPYYLAFADRAAYCGANAGSSEGYDPNEIFSLWGQGFEAMSDHFSFYDEEFEKTGESPYVEFRHEPSFDEEGFYGFQLTKSSLQNVLSVIGTVYQISDDGHDIISLGETCEIFQDWTTGRFTDEFDGYWFSLPDGQNLSVYLQTQTDTSDIYSSPVELNGRRTNLVIVREIDTGKAYITGIRDDVEDGMADRTDRRLKNGDRILPLYEASSLLDEDGDRDYEYYGEEYIYKKGDGITFELMPDGKYLFGFIIDDLYGDFYVTDYADFEVDGERVLYTE